MEPGQDDYSTAEEREARRRFLVECGRFAAVTPPAMAMLLTVTDTPTEAYASTIRGRPPDTPRGPPRKPGKPKT